MSWMHKMYVYTSLLEIIYYYKIYTNLLSKVKIYQNLYTQLQILHSTTHTREKSKQT